MAGTMWPRAASATAVPPHANGSEAHPVRGLRDGATPVVAFAAADREHLQHQRQETDDRCREDREVTTSTETQDRHQHCDKCARRDDTQHQVHEDGRDDHSVDARSWAKPTSAPENANNVAAGATPTSDAASTPVTSWRRVRGIVARRWGSRVSSLPKPRIGKNVQPSVASPNTTTATFRSGVVAPPGGQGREPGESDDERGDRADDEEHPGLTDLQAVFQEPELQSDECSSHDNPWRSVGSPTNATNASSSVPEPRNASSGPTHAIRPPTMTAT